MSLVPFTFNNVTLQVVTVDGKEWCRAKEVCKALEYQRRHCKDCKHYKNHLQWRKLTHKYQLSGVHVAATPINWPSDSQKYDLYISEEGLYELGV